MNRRKAIQKTGLLAGVTISGSSFLSLLQSCKDIPRISWEPLFLSGAEAACISAIVDLILPRTTSPGALDVKADIFLDKVFAESYTAEAQEAIRGGIVQFNADCKVKLGKKFIELSKDQQIAVLQAAETTSGKIPGSIWGTAVGEAQEFGFYRGIKSMAIWAFFTSEEIGENVLSYDPIPQQYKGCIPLAEVEKRWSL